MHRGPIAEIDLTALTHNLNIIKNAAGKSRVIAVVKADAYGHGSARVARQLSSAGVDFFAVAYCDEAVQLRDAGITARILVLFDTEEIGSFLDYDLIPVLSDIKVAEAFSAACVKTGKRIPVHMKIDTGMGRMGFMPDVAVSSAMRITELEGIELKGLLSHFSSAGMYDHDFALSQLGMFCNIRDEIYGRTGLNLLSHMCNSAAIFSLQGSCLDAVRPGISLYGYSSLDQNFGLRPVMKLKSKIMSIRILPAGSYVSYGRTYKTVRDSRIAVVPVGYADGYSRLFSNNAEVLIRGKRAPVIGRVCMDVCMVDVTGIKDAENGDEVVMIGTQKQDSITAAELASKINTIPYEVLTSLGIKAIKEYVC